MFREFVKTVQNFSVNLALGLAQLRVGSRIFWNNQEAGVVANAPPPTPAPTFSNNVNHLQQPNNVPETARVGANATARGEIPEGQAREREVWMGEGAV